MMIWRRYFYLMETQQERSKFAYGIIAYRSFMANPGRALDAAVSGVQKEIGCDRSVIKVCKFNRI